MKIFTFVTVLFFCLQLDAQNDCSPKLSLDSFQIELKKIKLYDFDQAKKESIEILFSYCLTSLQVKALLKELSFEEDKLELAKKAYSQVSDPSKFNIVKDIFDFEASKKEIDIIINRKK
jgi:hypothetical protein